MENKENKEEISLLDLVAVLIRYRKMIIIGTVVAVVFAALWFIVKPKLTHNENDNLISVTYTITENNIPKELQDQIFENQTRNLPMSVSSFALSYINSPSYFSDINKKIPLFVKDEEDLFVYNTKIYDLFDKTGGKTPKVEIKENQFKDGFTIKFLITRNDFDLAQEFIDYIIADTENKLEAFLNPKIDSYIEQIENKLKEASIAVAGEKNVSVNNQLLQESVALNTTKAFKASFKSYIIQNGTPFAVSAGKSSGRGKKAVITVIAGFCLMILVAFIRNAISNIKKDPEANKIVSDAWKAGK